MVNQHMANVFLSYADARIGVYGRTRGPSALVVFTVTSCGTKCRVSSQLTRGVDLMLFYCGADVEDGGPTLEQHWVNASCLLGLHCKESFY